MPGGPKTAAGKQASRRNAVIDGLSAQALLSEILGRDLIESSYQGLAAEWQPETATDRVLIREMARHQVALERIQTMEEATLRRGADASLSLDVESLRGPRLADEVDLALAGAGTAEAVDRISRYRRAHERGFYRSLSALNVLREHRQNTAEVMSSRKHPGPDPADSRFQTENDCEAYLLSRYRSGQVPCSQCGSRTGQFFPSRKTWQCAGCRKQISLRANSVMAASRVGLVAWFRLIQLLVHEPQAKLAALAEATRIKRPGTLRRMVQAIRAALESEDCSNRLAGLNVVFGRNQTPGGGVCH